MTTKFIEISGIIIDADSIITISKTLESIIIRLKYDCDINPLVITTKDDTLQIFNKLKLLLDSKSVNIL